jgi:arylsulfatase I/J
MVQADWYATFAKIAGANYMDMRSHEANVGREQKGLDLLPEVDGVPMWDDILALGKGRGNQSLPLSPTAIIMYPYKLLTGKIPYSRWTGPSYPNCSTWASDLQGGGPVFVDTKVLGSAFPYSFNDTEYARAIWQQDCGDGCLFDIEKDPTEHVDLAKVMPKKLKELQTELAKANLTLFLPDRGEMRPQACQVYAEHGGYYGPFVDADTWYMGNQPAPAVDHLEFKAKMLQIINIPKVTECLIGLTKLLTPTLYPVSNQKMDVCLTHNLTLPYSMKEIKEDFIAKYVVNQSYTEADITQFINTTCKIGKDYIEAGGFDHR